jgi:hypothetical protein
VSPTKEAHTVLNFDFGFVEFVSFDYEDFSAAFAAFKFQKPIFLE